MGNEKFKARCIYLPIEVDELVNEVKDRLFGGNRSRCIVYAITRYLETLRGSEDENPAILRKEIDALIDFVRIYDAKGLAWMKMGSSGLESQIAKFFPPALLEMLAGRMEASEGDLLLFVDADTALEPGALRKAVHLMREKRADLLSFIPSPASIGKDGSEYHRNTSHQKKICARLHPPLHLHLPIILHHEG